MIEMNTRMHSSKKSILKSGMTIASIFVYFSKEILDLKKDIKNDHNCS